MTLRQIIEQHPDWADLPVAVQDSGGELYFVSDGAGAVYKTDEGEVVFTGN
jgi:hypothetical protein